MVYVFAMSLRFGGPNYVFTSHFSTFRPANGEHAASMQGAARWKRLEAVRILAYGVSTTMSRQARQPSYPRWLSNIFRENLDTEHTELTETHGKRFLNADLSVFVRVFRVFRVQEISITEILGELPRFWAGIGQTLPGRPGWACRNPVAGARVRFGGEEQRCLEITQIPQLLLPVLQQNFADEV